jgi:glycerophosphoryl diester phosphodiesterase
MRTTLFLLLMPVLGCGTATVAPADTEAADMADVTSGVDAATDATATVNLHLRPGFLNIAHRGGGKLAPEETLVAYQNAIAKGADVVECDVHSTLDGALVCLHDDTVDRTTNGTGAITQMTLADLRKLDAGFKFTPDGGLTFPFRGKGHQVATLDEFLLTFPQGGYSIEIKQADPPIGPQVVQAIVAHNAMDQTVLVSFNDATMAEVRQLEPRLTTAMAIGEMLVLSGMEDADEATYTPPARIIQAPTTQMDPALLVARAHRLGIKVQFWTINDAKEMAQLIAVGADGIFTDDPQTLAGLVVKP